MPLPPSYLKPLLYLYVYLARVASKLKAKVNEVIDWVLSKIATWLISYYLSHQADQA